MTNPNEREQNESQDQVRTLRSGRKLYQPHRSNQKNRKTNRQTNSPDQLQDLQSEIPPPQPAPRIQTDSEGAKEWKNLDNDFSYSGNTVTILDKIKSFS